MTRDTSNGEIKLFGLISRRKDMTFQAFHDHYRHPHGTLALTMSTLTGYVQSHRIHTDLIGPGQARFEAVAEIWVASEGDLKDFRSEPHLVRYLVPDEPNFMDIPNSAFLPTRVQAVQACARHAEADHLWSPGNRPVSYKLIQLVRAGAHSALDALELGSELGALRTSWCIAMVAFQAAGPEFGGVREFWWPTLTAFRAGAARSPQATQRVLCDPAVAYSMLAQAERLI